MVYKDCKLYGPYSNSADGRLRCMIVFPNKKRKTISYPKYLMEVHLGRYLDIDETIDHIDGNFLNNDISNLRVVYRKQHAIEDAVRNKDVIVNCEYCGKEFTIKGSKLHNRNRKDNHQSGYFCSKQCVGKYGQKIQCKLIEHTTKDIVVADKYTIKTANKGDVSALAHNQ